uniref:Kynurenine/alpha-aminoadipate aminotransferase, mitochondrial n=1 Tax=Eptatretus burgeri TaxID=7764 RepID=A0A8C4QCH3_EPTBU
MNYDRFLNSVSSLRQLSPIRGFASETTHHVSLAGGYPNPDMFPFASATFTLKDGRNLKIDGDLINMSFQYSSSEGLPELIDWLKVMQKTFHNPPTWSKKVEQGGTELCITAGSQEALSKVFEMLLTNEDTIVTNSYVYCGALQCLRPMGVHFLTIESDESGMVPAALSKALSSFPPNRRPPRVIYIVPNGENPTGITLTLERKKAIYQIAKKFDLLIVEDDPYFFMQFNKSRIPSFLSLDIDGRVLRLDSFSKIISAGLRLGFLTGPKMLVDRVILHVQVSTIHCSTLCQVLMLQLLRIWGLEGFLEHANKISDFYKSQRDLMIESAHHWLNGLAEWNKPQGGMFLWIKLVGITDTYDLIMQKAKEKKVLFVPGRDFLPDNTMPSPFVRASFSLSSQMQMDKGLKTLAEILKNIQS